MSVALNATGRPIAFNMRVPQRPCARKLARRTHSPPPQACAPSFTAANRCEWGDENPWEWGNNVAQSWRMAGDHTGNWDSTKSVIRASAAIPAANSGHPYGWKCVAQACIATTRCSHSALAAPRLALPSLPSCPR